MTAEQSITLSILSIAGPIVKGGCTGNRAEFSLVIEVRLCTVEGG